jgi:hypothetical protein
VDGARAPDSDRTLLPSSWLALTIACLALLATVQGVRADSASDAVELVRPVYIDAFPAERARALDAAGVARLAELLRDPEESAAHCNAVTALGFSGHPDAYAALAASAEPPPQGELSRARYCAALRLPLAMGHLARRDARALAWLEQAAAHGARDPGWSYGPDRGARLALLLREQVLTGLALSGRPEASAWLDAQAATTAQDPVSARLRRHAQALRALHAQSAGEVTP